MGDADEDNLPPVIEVNGSWPPWIECLVFGLLFGVLLVGMGIAIWAVFFRW